MKAFWLNEALTIKPESTEERAALESLQAALGNTQSDLVGVCAEIPTGPVSGLNDK